MTDLQIELTKLIGKKDLTFGCLFQVSGDVDMLRYVDDDYCVVPNGMVYEPPRWKEKFIIGHPATLSDFHRWLNENKDKWFEKWRHDSKNFCVGLDYQNVLTIQYDSSKDLLDQSEDTLQQIIDLVKEYS